jgi:hypothetical protein
VGIELTKGLATDTLKNLGNKTLDYFKGKGKAQKPQIDSLKLAIIEKDTESYKEQAQTVLELLKTTVESDPDFRNEVESIIKGLDEKTKQDLEKQVSITIANSENVVAGSTIGNITGDFIVGDGHSANPKKD